MAHCVEVEDCASKENVHVLPPKHPTLYNLSELLACTSTGSVSRFLLGQRGRGVFGLHGPSNQGLWELSVTSMYYGPGGSVAQPVMKQCTFMTWLIKVKLWRNCKHPCDVMPLWKCPVVTETPSMASDGVSRRAVPFLREIFQPLHLITLFWGSTGFTRKWG